MICVATVKEPRNLCPGSGTPRGSGHPGDRAGEALQVAGFGLRLESRDECVEGIELFRSVWDDFDVGVDPTGVDRLRQALDLAPEHTHKSR